MPRPFGTTMRCERTIKADLCETLNMQGSEAEAAMITFCTCHVTLREKAKFTPDENSTKLLTALA